VNAKSTTTGTGHDGHRGDCAPGVCGATVEAAQAASSAETDRYLTFQLGGERYALPLLGITEIMEFRALATAPTTPTLIRGVIHLRGQVVPVLDLASRFDQGRTHVAQRTSVIIVDTAPEADPEADPEARSHHIGILVDAVGKVLHLDRTDIEPPPSFGPGVRGAVGSGMARYDGESIVVLDVNRIMSTSEMTNFDRSMTTRDNPTRDNPTRDNTVEQHANASKPVSAGRS
jgi:purine-binding chemotaxis protein CheW